MTSAAAARPGKRLVQTWIPTAQHRRVAQLAKGDRRSVASWFAVLIEREIANRLLRVPLDEAEPPGRTRRRG